MKHSMASQRIFESPLASNPQKESEDSIIIFNPSHPMDVLGLRAWSFGRREIESLNLLLPDLQYLDGAPMDPMWNDDKVSVKKLSYLMEIA